MRFPVEWPIVTQHFGQNPQIYKKFGMKGHNGIDFRARIDTPIFAAIDGVVENYINHRGYGNHIKQVNKKYQVIYAHLSAFKKHSGDFVKAGEMIGWSGNTGFSTGPHLHFGVRELNIFGGIKNYHNGYYGWVDPWPYFQKTINCDNMITKILKLFRQQHSQAGFALITLPHDHGRVFLIKDKKKHEVKGRWKLLQALLAAHCIGVSNEDAAKIPTGKKF